MENETSDKLAARACGRPLQRVFSDFFQQASRGIFLSERQKRDQRFWDAGVQLLRLARALL